MAAKEHKATYICRTFGRALWMENLFSLIGQRSEYLSAQSEALRRQCPCSSCGVVTADVHFRNVVFSLFTFTEEELIT